MKQEFNITLDGKKELEQELQELKSRRGEIADKIAEARDFGDLSENAEYDAARTEQGIVETRITEIENILQKAKIITSKKSDVVALGSKVTIKTGGKTVTYQIVGPVEADPMDGKISDESPIGSVLIGKKAGEEVTIKAPKGDITYKIEEVK